jgi:hypothetical protein
MALIKNTVEYTPKRIADLAMTLAGNLDVSIGEIQEVNEQTKILAINAKITASRAGDAGKSFGVVADEIMNLSHRTSEVSKTLEAESRGSIDELITISRLLDSNVRGERLSIYAHNNIDLIDRNLYERSCDVRWWATDSSLVEALQGREAEACRFASQRMRVILSAYTVYFDLVLANKDGEIIANGRPDLYASKGKQVSGQEWFQKGLKSRSGDEFGLQSVHASELVNRQRALIYSCAVRQGGSTHGEVLGVLGIVFNWDGLAQVVVKNTPLAAAEWQHSRVFIADVKGLVLADSDENSRETSLQLSKHEQVFSGKRGFLEMPFQNRKAYVAFAPSDGFETYQSGWYSIVIQYADQTK